MIEAATVGFSKIRSVDQIKSKEFTATVVKLLGDP